MAVSAALIGFGLTAALRLRAGRPLGVGPVHVAVAVAGGILVVVSFLVDTERVTASDVPAWSGWPLFWLGMGLATIAAVTALARPGSSSGRR
jgi:hypothetical protein